MTDDKPSFTVKRLQRIIFKFLAIAIALIGMPILGTTLTDYPLSLHFEFPPHTRFITHSPFSWIAFALFSSLILICLIPIVLMGLRAQRPDREYRHPTRTFPWWGWLGICSVILTWIFAWTRIPWFETYQPHTFTPLWLSFILVVNAWTYRRTGHCLLVDRPRYFLWLFPASAFFWWFFEFLNRFVQNWYYIGVEHFSPSAYFGYASFAFATVLPAVLSVRDALLSCPWIQERFSQMPSIPMTFTPGKGIAFLLFGAAGLFAAGAAPNYFFPLLWIAPLSVLLSMEIIGRQDGSLRQAIRGDWRDIVAAMLAALICGIFWEMWNYYSYAKWIYSIPWVHRFQIFEMPILGYAGNLPFGWVCLIIGNLINNIIPKR